MQYNNGYVSEDMVCPPSRVISFNSDIRNNDGLLANSLVRREGVSYEMALSLIADEVSSYKIQLNNGGEIAFNHIGIFANGGDGSVEFTPFNDGKIKNDLYGFSSISFPKLNGETNENHNKPKRNVIYIPVSKNIFKVAASIVLLIGMSMLLSTPITVNHIQNYATMGVVKSADIALDSSNSFTKESVAGEESVEVAEEPMCEIVNGVSFSSNYYLIVGSFETEDMAKKHILQYREKVSELEILYNGYKYMVYAATGDSFKSLKPKYNDMQANFADAWIYKFK